MKQNTKTVLMCLKGQTYHTSKKTVAQCFRYTFFFKALQYYFFQILTKVFSELFNRASKSKLEMQLSPNESANPQNS